MLRPSASSQVALGAFLFIPTQVRNPIPRRCQQQPEEITHVCLTSYDTFVNVKTKQKRKRKEALNVIARDASMKRDKRAAAASSFGEAELQVTHGGGRDGSKTLETCLTGIYVCVYVFHVPVWCRHCDPHWRGARGPRVCRLFAGKQNSSGYLKQWKQLFLDLRCRSHA